MNVEIGAEAAQFPEKEYISGIAVAVQKEENDTYPLLTLTRNNTYQASILKDS
jgi:hypothetical protein